MANSQENFRLRFFYAILLTIAFFILFPVTLVLFLPVYLFRFMVSLLARVFRSDLGKLIPTRSAVLAIDDFKGSPQWNLCVWIVLSGTLDYSKFCKNFFSNIVLKKQPNGQWTNPEYRQYYHSWLGFLFWKWERNFIIEEHMKTLSPEVMTEPQLKDIVKYLTWSPFEEERSPWEFIFVPNYQSADDNGDKCVVILRVHHGFCDGYTILRLMIQELNNIVMEDIVTKPAYASRSFFSQIIFALSFWIRAPYETMAMLLRSRDCNDWHDIASNGLTAITSEESSKCPVEFHPPLTKMPFSTAWTDRIPLHLIKSIKNFHDVSFSAVIFAAITGGLQKIMMQSNARVPTLMTTAVAVPMPGHPKTLSNHFIFSFLKLPMGTQDPLKRLHKVEASLKRLKNSPAPLMNFALLPLVGALFPWMMKIFSVNPYSTVLTSNFPGPEIIGDFVAGGGHNTVLEMNFSAGLGEGNVRFGFCMLSSGGYMRIITSAHPQILPTDEQVAQLNKEILNELELLKSLISKSTE